MPWSNRQRRRLCDAPAEMSPLRFFDPPCPPNPPRFEGDFAEALARARAAGVSELVIIGWDLPSCRRAVEMADPDAGLFAAAGFHPHDAEGWSAAAEKEIRAMAGAAGTVAIGEIGLDFYRHLSPRDAQYVA